MFQWSSWEAFEKGRAEAFVLAVQAGAIVRDIRHGRSIAPSVVIAAFLHMVELTDEEVAMYGGLAETAEAFVRKQYGEP